MKTTEEMGEVMISSPKGACALTPAKDAIQTAKDKGRIGFKRKAVRC